MDDLTAQFGRAVRRARAQHGWSQEQLAGRAEVNRSYLGEVERAAVTPSLATAAKLARALQVPLSVLIARCEAVPAATATQATPQPAADAARNAPF
jgi:transcriptional regulator with XRE-family HTH domain